MAEESQRQAENCERSDTQFHEVARYEINELVTYSVAFGRSDGEMPYPTEPDNAVPCGSRAARALKTALYGIRSR